MGVRYWRSWRLLRRPPPPPSDRGRAPARISRTCAATWGIGVPAAIISTAAQCTPARPPTCTRISEYIRPQRLKLRDVMGMPPSLMHTAAWAKGEVFLRHFWICCIGGKGRAARRLRPAQAVRPKICCTKARCAGMSPLGTARTCPLASIAIASMPASVRFAVQKP